MATDQVKTRTAVWHPHSERPVYEYGGDNRIVTCLDMRHMFPAGRHEGLNFCYDELQPDGSTVACAYAGRSARTKKRLAVKWEHHYKQTWWAYVRDLIPEGI